MRSFSAFLPAFAFTPSNVITRLYKWGRTQVSLHRAKGKRNMFRCGEETRERKKLHFNAAMCVLMQLTLKADRKIPENTSMK